MKRICKLLISMLSLFIIITVNSYAIGVTSKQYAKETTPKVDSTKKIYDYANLLTAEQERSLYNSVQNYIQNYKMDMVIVTINENNKASSMDYADDFYDYNDFGIGTNKSGILFLMDMQNRQMWISTTGKAIKVYTDKYIDIILDYAYNKIAKQDYNGCAETFIKYASNYASYTSEEKGNSRSETFSTSVLITSALKFAGVIALIGTFIYIIRGVISHRNVKVKKEASHYAQLQLTENTDSFLNRNVTKRRIETSSSSSGSSSTTHRSSSGRTHGGGGRRF